MKLGRSIARILRCLLVVACCGLAAVAQAQDVGGGGDTGGDGGFGGGGGFGGDGGLGGLIDLGEAFSLQEDITIEPSLRFERGYIGPIGGDINAEGLNGRSIGFVGQRNEGDYGGGFNDTLTLGSTTNAGRGAGGGFVGGAGSQLSFSVTRRGVRARLQRPNFFTTRAQIDSVGFATQFVSRMDRLPAARTIEKQYQVEIVGRTAILTGMVASEAEQRRLIGQLRLEPGIYRIDNRLQVGQ